MGNSVLLGQRLIGSGKISQADLERALEYQQASADRLGAILVRFGAISEESLLPVLAEQTGYSLIASQDIAEQEVLDALDALQLSADWARQKKLLVWREQGDWHAASRDPLDLDIQDDLACRSAAQVHWHFVRSLELEQVLAGLGMGFAQAGADAKTLREMAEDAPTISLVNSVIAQAIDERASDVHFEPGEHQCQVRFRVDGVLHARQDFSMDRYPAVSSRLKLIADLDIAERRLPQDGRTTVRAAGSEMDLRVSVVPATWGESIVLRLLPKKREELSLDRLGLDAAQLVDLRSWMQMPNGIVLVTGPTGSGKSTTLYGALAEAANGERKIVTAEDPVEHRIGGVIQVQTIPDIGYTFAKALRAFLRHDPDVIMIGEIRDQETAEIAIQAALTGHLVLASLHTNDALSAFTRLVDMGVEPFLVSAACQAVMAQRLVRRLCSHCSVPDPNPVPPGLMQHIPAGKLPRPLNFRRAVGCAHCQGTGYAGRVGIYELVGLENAMRHAVAENSSVDALASIARERGHLSLRADGVIKAAQGLTSLDEVLRVTAADATATLEELSANG